MISYCTHNDGLWFALLSSHVNYTKFFVLYSYIIYIYINQNYSPHISYNRTDYKLSYPITAALCSCYIKTVKYILNNIYSAYRQ